MIHVKLTFNAQVDFFKNIFQLENLFSFLKYMKIEKHDNA